MQITAVAFSMKLLSCKHLVFRVAGIALQHGKLDKESSVTDRHRSCSANDLAVCTPRYRILSSF